MPARMSIHGYSTSTTRSIPLGQHGILLVPHQQGMKTALVVEAPGNRAGEFVKPQHVDAVIEDLTAFLADVTPRARRS